MKIIQLLFPHPTAMKMDDDDGPSVIIMTTEIVIPTISTKVMKLTVGLA
jgi:hypothetical protein